MGELRIVLLKRSGVGDNLQLLNKIIPALESGALIILFSLL